MFGTALYGEAPRETGVGDPMVDIDNERGLVAMQWGAFRRFWGAFWKLSGWRPGDVAFSADYTPIATRDMDLHAFAHAPAVASASPADAACSREAVVTGS